MSTDIVKQIPHAATEYELEAAKRGVLRAIILPLVPEPINYELMDCLLWRVAIDDYVNFSAMEQGELLKRMPYQIGDRLYLQEEWWDDRITDAPDEKFAYHLKSNDPHLTHGWEPPPHNATGSGSVLG